MDVGRAGRTPNGVAALLLTLTSLGALSRLPLFGLEWLYAGGTWLISVAWAVSPMLCLMTIALIGGLTGYQLAMKEVSDQLIRERWDRELRSRPSKHRDDIHLEPVRILISPPSQSQS